FACGTAAEASRRERDKVSSALLLWKLHTQGKAFAALAAHRLRRRWKQDRARRAVGWRRERLIKDGAARWAATADSLSASRISSAACREGTKAARRWEAAGRCARHWRRVAAARGMERRARDQPRSNVSRVPRKDSGYLGSTPGSLVSCGRIGCTSDGASVDEGGGGGVFARADAPAERRVARGETFVGRAGKENQDCEANLYKRRPDVASTAAGRSVAGVGFRPPSCQEGEAVQRGTTKGDVGTCGPEFRYDEHRDIFRSGNGNPETVGDDRGGSPAYPAVPASKPGLSWSLSGRGLSLSAPVPLYPLETTRFDMRGPAAEKQLPKKSTETTAAVAPGEAAGMLRALSRIPDKTASNSYEDRSSLSFGGSSRDDGEELEDHRPPSPTIAVCDLAQAALPHGENSPGVALWAAGALVGSDGHRRPAPRRPLELLLDETSQFATASSSGGQLRLGGGGKIPSRLPPTPLSSWVVDEMNRLFGVRGAFPGDLGRTVNARQDRGQEHVAVSRNSGDGDQVQIGQLRPRRGGGVLRSGGQDSVSFPGGDRNFRRPSSRAEEETDQYGEGLVYADAAVSSRANGRTSGPGKYGVDRHQHCNGNGPRRHGSEESTELPLRRPMGPMGRSASIAAVNRQVRAPEAQGSISTTKANRADTSPSPRDRGCRRSPPNRTPEDEATSSRTESGEVLGTIASTVPTASRACVGRLKSSSYKSAARQNTAAAKEAQESLLGCPSTEKKREMVCPSVDVEYLSSPAGPTPRPGMAYPAGDDAPAAPALHDANTLAEVAAATAVGAPTPSNNSRSAPQQSSSAPSSDGAVQEKILEVRPLVARVAEAERRLIFLQERASQRRRDKRELAALHQALADQESMQTKSGGQDGADGGNIAARGAVDGGKDAALRPGGDSVGRRDDTDDSDGLVEREALDALPSTESPSDPGVNSERRLTATLLGAGSAYVASLETLPALDDIEHDLAPTTSGTSFRRALLVRMGLVRARLDSGSRKDEGHRPVAESLLREIEELSKSG
ncbi:unnamed protein product, partial [Hapterophycus canaliculatus]